MATRTLDVINKLFGLNIQVYLEEKHKGKERGKLTKDNSNRGVIPIVHDGNIHFNWLKSIEIEEDKKISLLLQVKKRIYPYQ